MSNSSVIAVNHLPNYQDRSQRGRSLSHEGSGHQERRCDDGGRKRDLFCIMTWGGCWVNADSRVPDYKVCGDNG